jgi:hypothetical protein
MAAMKRTVLALSLLWVLTGTTPASAAFLGENPRLGESFPNTTLLRVSVDVNRELPPGSGGSCLERPAECFVAPVEEPPVFEPVPENPGGGTSTLRPGPYAGESIPAPAPGQPITPAMRAQLNEIGSETGCHTCGSTNPGTGSGNFIPDHQPPTAMTLPGQPQRLYPQCLGCSRTQGGQVRAWQQ